MEFIDSICIRYAHKIRTLRRKTFDGIALRVNEIIGLIYGFKLHLIVNHHDKIVVAKVKKFEC
ncbi:transposase [Pseudoalteromonas tetraodonis]|uniref:transposase n=1 Tax=Pseudoalteromonas TaxID=53246 RepID=UPI000C634C33|nr:hypothetical protein [Pseudoalteromonas sp.]